MARGFQLEDHPIIHPHEILWYLFTHAGIQIMATDVESYWLNAKQFGEEWALLSPGTNRHVPVGLYGDAARTMIQYKYEKITSVFLNLVLWRPRSMRYSRFLLFSCETSRMIKNRTLNVVFRRITWSLNAAFDGIWPLTGCRGKELSPRECAMAGTFLSPGKEKFMVTEFRGDWEYHRDIWRLKASWQGNDVCMFCPAVARGPLSMLYYNTGATPEHQCEWIKNLFTQSQFVARRLKDRQLCTL